MLHGVSCAALLELLSLYYVKTMVSDYFMHILRRTFTPIQNKVRVNRILLYE